MPATAPIPLKQYDYKALPDRRQVLSLAVPLGLLFSAERIARERGVRRSVVLIDAIAQVIPPSDSPPGSDLRPAA